MSKRNSRLRGIVVMADNQEQAVELFSAVASGTYRVLESKDGAFAIATAQSDLQLLNPLNGEEMVAVPEDEKHEMVAVASNTEEDMDAFYQACSSGCGAHVITDSLELLDKCPACASDLPQMEDADLKKNNQPKELLLAVATDRVSAVEAFRALASGEGETFAAKCDDVMVISNQPINFDIYKNIEAEKVEGYVPQLAVASAATEDGKMKVHYLVTASDEGPEMHIVASNQSPIFCPVTNMGLVDPEDDMSAEQKAVASADFLAKASDDEDEEEEEDDEEFEEEEEEEEDPDDEEEEEEEEEEDDDDDLSLGLAASKGKKKGGVRKKVKPEMATASAKTEAEQLAEQNAAVANAENNAENTGEQPAAAAAPVVAATPEVVAPVEVTASFVSIASTDMKENTVDVNYVGNVQGEPTWMAFHNGIPFAKAIASASENPATFADPAIGRAFKAIASEQGVPAALQQLRFEEIKPVLQIEQVVAEQIKSQVTEQGNVLAEATARDKSELATRYESALATAAHGINTGYFRDLNNPIVTALASSLEAVGLSGAEELLQRAFIEHSPEYHASILAKAGEIMNFEQVVQNQMAVAVTQIEPKNVATASSLSVGRPVQTPAQVQQENVVATASAQQPQTDFKTKLTGLKLF
jgi:hypothetical protein